MQKFVKFNVDVAEQKAIFDKKQLVVEQRQLNNMILSKDNLKELGVEVDMRKKKSEKEGEQMLLNESEQDVGEWKTNSLKV